MKRFNLISILILFFTFFGVQSVVGTERTANIVNETSAPYYAIYNNSSEKIKLNENLDITLAYPCNNVDFKITTTRFIAWGTAKIAIDATKTGNWDDTEGIHEQNYSGDSQSGSQSFNTTEYSKIAFKCTGGANSDEYVHDVKFTIAPHIRLLNKTENNVTYTSINENTINTATATLDFGTRDVNQATSFTIDFKSFLAQSGKNFTATLSNNSNFYFTNYTTENQITINDSFCKLNEATGNFSITFKPKENGNKDIEDRTATLTITDGTSTAIITLVGKSQKIAQTLKWVNMPDQMVLGERIVTNGLAQSNCTTSITYTSSNPDIIKITEDGYLVAKQPTTPGTVVTITATNSGNGKYKSATITKDVTVTTLSLQQIVWEQSFTLLKIGQAAQTLTAHVIDVATGKRIEGAQITFTSNNPNVVSISGNTLTIVYLGSTTIVATTPETDTHAATTAIKTVYVREAKATCEDQYIINETTEIKKTYEGYTSDRNIVKEYSWNTIGSKLEFTAYGSIDEVTATDNTNNKNISLTNSNGKYSGNIDRNTKKITITIKGEGNTWIWDESTISLSNIIVHPAIYLDPSTNAIVFEETKMGETRNKTIDFNYANKPDAIWATIVDDEETEGDHSNNFTFENSESTNSISWGEGCGDINTKQLSIKFTPTQGGTYKAKLLVGVGENGKIEHTIPLSATATKINHTLKWNDGIDNEIELNSIFNCNGKAFIVDDDGSHTIKYDFDPTFFYTLEEYPGYLYAIKEGETEIIAYIEETETCTRQEAKLKVKILPEKATMTWEQNLSNFVEAESNQIITLTATSNKEGEIVYEIVSNEDNIISLNGNQLTINGGVIGTAEIKAYNTKYQDVYIIKNVIVASVKPCETEIDHRINLETEQSIIGQDKEVSCTLTLDKKCQSVSFTTDLTGDGMNGESYGIVTVSDNIRGEILNERFYDNGISRTCDIDPEATQVVIKVKAVSITGSVTPVTAKLMDVKTMLISTSDNYTTDKDAIDFGTSSIGTSSRTEELKINYWALPGNIDLSIESGNETATPFSVEPTILTENCGIGEKTITIKLNPTIGGTFNDFLVIKTGGDEVVRKIPLTAIINKIDQAITWTTELLTTADRQVQLARSEQGVLMNYEIVSGNEYASVENNYLGIPSVSVVNAGTFEVRAYNDGDNTYNAISDIKIFTSSIGTIRFDTDGDWNTTSNWLPVSNLNKQRNVAPSAVVNAVIEATATISNSNCEINDLKFDTNGALTIDATSGLKAKEVTNATADNLTLQSSSAGNGAFVFASGKPSATVEMYSKAQYGTTATDGHHPQWQYMGVAVDGAKVGDFKYDDSRNAWLLEWNEKENTTGDPWKSKDGVLAENIDLIPWAGYSISQPEAKTYMMKGALINGDHTYELTRTTKEGAEKQDPDCGFNLLANSYTAPIDITKLKASNFVGADACIILYNTGTYADWESQQTTLGQNPGQLTAIPVESSRAIAEAGLPTTIASMQAFFVKANQNNATFTVDYETAVAGATNHGNQMRAPRAEKEFNVLKITIEGENTRDNLYLLENEETSKAYDNGYEAYKIFDAPRGHQMYATCQYGYASIDCSESFVGQTIGLKGDNEGEKLTISFDTDRLENYNSLFLYDKLTGEYINIIAGETYTFFGIKGANDNRFSIVTNPIDKNQTPPFVVIGDELAFDRAQIDTENANIYIYDTSGRLLKVDKINPYENYNIPDMPEGIYLVSINGYTTKIVKK